MAHFTHPSFFGLIADFEVLISNDRKTFLKAIENYDNRLKKEKAASKRKNKKSKFNPPRVKFVQGGQTGMVQQNLRTPPPKCSPKLSMIEYIYETI